MKYNLVFRAWDMSRAVKWCALLGGHLKDLLNSLCLSLCPTLWLVMGDHGKATSASMNFAREAVEKVDGR